MLRRGKPKQLRRVARDVEEQRPRFGFDVDMAQTIASLLEEIGDAHLELARVLRQRLQRHEDFRESALTTAEAALLGEAQRGLREEPDQSVEDLCEVLRRIDTHHHEEILRRPSELGSPNNYPSSNCHIG